MGLFSTRERKFAETISKMSFANPFLPDRIELEKEALGRDFDQSTQPFWSWGLSDEADRPNILLLTKRVADLATECRKRIRKGVGVTDAEWSLYDDIAHYVIYYETIAYSPGRDTTPKQVAATWESFCETFDHWMKIGDRISPSYDDRSHVFSYLSQLHAAFFNIFMFVLGRSWPIAKLRARIWQSIFTHDTRRYRRHLYGRMHEVSTLVTGPTGTGKELVGRAIGLSQYRAFDPVAKQFAGELQRIFVPVNLSALSSNLIESELFGHEKGAFTGAHSRRIGFLESVEPQGCLFLDEIGELDLTVQVKLLRVLQSRQFQRAGGTQLLEFQGRFISATNRDLLQEMQLGQLREDFYYRLCSDEIQTPSLAEQLADRQDDLEFLVDLIASRIGGGDMKDLTQDAVVWCRKKLPPNYQWPGNMRELEQCVRNIMIHNDYQPRIRQELGGSESELVAAFNSVALTADELLARYCKLAYQKMGSYEKAAEALGLDRRTVKARIQLLGE